MNVHNENDIINRNQVTRIYSKEKVLVWRKSLPNKVGDRSIASSHLDSGFSSKMSSTYQENEDMVKSTALIN